MLLKRPLIFFGLLLISPAFSSSGQADELCASGCEPPSCAPACERCVRLPDVTKVSKSEHACKREHFCLPKRSLFDLFSPGCHSGGDSCCDSCDSCDGSCASPCGQCECYARTRKVLLKRIVTEECPTYRCVPACALPEGCERCKKGSSD